MLMVRWLALCLFIWFMIYEVFVPLWNNQPLFPMIREFFSDVKDEEPAQADNTTKEKRGNNE